MPPARRDLERALLAWFDASGRDLPWRHTQDPYAILVSEIMLQQTQVPRVLPRYTAWLERWPTVGALAAAATAEVIRAWSGLGYNRRAVNLKRCAEAVVARGRFPQTVEELEALPGVGPYTARAVACFAFGAQVPAPDTNARRVLGRAFGDEERPPPPGEAYAWNQALFDLGSSSCLARRPRCGACPLAAGCPSRGRTYEPARRQSRFEGSFRQRRGRTLQALTAGAVPVRELDGDAVAALVRDGLAVVENGRARLPY